MDPRQPLLTTLRSEPLVIDGAMATQLHERGILYSACFEELAISRPELVSAVHEQYVRAGATLVITNTFGANAGRLDAHGLSARVREINTAAVKLAREAASDRAYVGGGIGPSLRDDVEGASAALREQAEALVEAGVDALVIETMVQPWELRVAINAAKAASHGTAVIAHVSVDARGVMADGTSGEDIGKQMRDLGADVIGVNCSHGPTSVMLAVESMLGLGLPVSAMPSAGLPERVGDRLVHPSTPEDFGLCARRMFGLGLRLFGGCCGTTPAHIEHVARASEARA